MEVRTEYDKKLNEVQSQLIGMGKLVTEALEKSIKALETKNAEVAETVVNGDRTIDEMQITIEDKTLELIALQQPIAKDLRILSTALKMTTDLERIGDHAKKIAKIAMKLSGEELIKPLIDIPKAAKLSADMVGKVLVAYVHMDLKLAMEVIAMDEKVDGICRQCKQDILAYMLDNPQNIPQGTELNKIVHRLERIGDHATNLAEWIGYLITGKRIQKLEED
ncbi:MAG: phosphate signaling complex protein PhoU [Acidaminococcaceae bacterium]|jgi:phosphate transport system protein|nr:phosphate signaling complex protein PhoU [Acidaminococcaceae bacterium]